MIPDANSYERLLALVANIRRSQSRDDRTITWCESSGRLGVARAHDDRLEIFLAGPELKPRSRLLHENLEYQVWYREREEQPPLAANRLLLPVAEHFDQVAAFLCTELIRNGIAHDLQQAFARTEPVIELAIERLRVADSAVLGLSGELLFLEALVRAVPDGTVPVILDAWKGYREASRDLQLADVGVEIKTTARTVSSHEIQGVHQVEVGHGVDGVGESALLLVSIGLQWDDAHEEHPNATSIPRLVDAIVDRTRLAMAAGADAVLTQFLKRLAEYGSQWDVGYDHTARASRAVFRRSFRNTFVRCYDMGDELIRVLSGDDVRARPNVEFGSVRYRLNLPDIVRGDANPVVGLNESAQVVLARARA